MNSESRGPGCSVSPLPLWESIGRLRRPFLDTGRLRRPFLDTGRLRRPFLEKNAEAKLRLCRIADAIRARGYALSMDRNPSPQPSPTRGEGGALPLPLQINLISSCSRLERFRTEQTPFRVKKTRQNKR